MTTCTLLAAADLRISTEHTVWTNVYLKNGEVIMTVTDASGAGKWATMDLGRTLCLVYRLLRAHVMSLFRDNS